MKAISEDSEKLAAPHSADKRPQPRARRNERSGKNAKWVESLRASDVNRLWSELHPGYVKIDHHFIENISTDHVKREFVRSIGGMAARLGCQVVAEGIETAEDYAVVQSLGLRLHQGYHLARPLSEPVRNHVPAWGNGESAANPIRLSQYLGGFKRYREMKV